MNINDTKICMLPVSVLETNKGQVEGLPKNPRFIRDARYEKLKKSIADAPEMLHLRELIVFPLGDKYVIVGGNMRYRACCDLGYTEVPCKVLPEDTPVEKLREYAIKDNNEFGQNDYDLLANEWDESELEEWGVETGFMPSDVDMEGLFDDENSTKDKDTVTIQVILPSNLKDKEEDIRKNIQLTLAEYGNIKIK